MDQGALNIVLWIAGLGVTVISGLLGWIATLLLRGADRRDRGEEGTARVLGRTQERFADKQVSDSSWQAGMTARMQRLEEGHSKVAEALDRLTRLEEFRLHAMPKLEEAEETARTVIAFGEQMKSVFKRIDAMTDAMSRQSEKIDKIPSAVAAELRSWIRPARAANG